MKIGLINFFKLKKKEKKKRMKINFFGLNVMPMGRSAVRLPSEHRKR